MSEKSEKAGEAKKLKRLEALKEELWGEELKELPLWNRKRHVGFTTVPRTLPYICRILDELSGKKGQPLSQVYLALWFRSFDNELLELKDKDSLAYESGFSGERAITTWLSRMRQLKELGFISAKPGTSGEFHNVLILNPLAVIKKIYEEKQHDERYNSLASRMSEVKATWE